MTTNLAVAGCPIDDQKTWSHFWLSSTVPPLESIGSKSVRNTLVTHLRRSCRPDLDVLAMVLSCIFKINLNLAFADDEQPKTFARLII
jgi:hypothetical protein